ncbi:hypothetical protein Scep_030892 [Stephania cephalantha]|uniref:Fibronectin type III-like domain-containing protein n=1 Tax=Stephania cephalantha TaxID=152367 RepID=A0AAP0HHD0_9MAGN
MGITSTAHLLLIILSCFTSSLVVSNAARVRLLEAVPTASFAPNTAVCDAGRLGSQGLDVTKLGYCDKSLSYYDRVKALVDGMTLDEKVGQLGDRAAGVARLGLPPYLWWSEALHGVSSTGHGTFFNATVPGATSFPTVIVTAASFNETLWKTIGQVVSNEARAMFNLGNTGLTFWSPNINVVRDPRWGRVMETPGEDPFVVARYSVNFVRGLQDLEGAETATDLNSRPLKTAACCKHYAAYDLENWLGVDRWHFNANVTEQDMLETFSYPFEICVREGDASSAMCSFNRVNGIPVCADPKLMKQNMRDEWGLHGYIVSDCDSIEVIVDGQKWLGDTEVDAVAQVMKAGLDLDCGKYYTNFGKAAVEQGKIKESDIDNALKNLYAVLMRLGYFDGMPMFDSLGKQDICSADNMELAADAARQGIVLLKNNATLPFTNVKTLAVVGPHANATDAMIGNYAGVPCKYTSPFDGLSKYAQVTYEPGCDIACKNESLIFKAMQASMNADATVILVGLDTSMEREGVDRVDLNLPGYQTQLINQVAMVSKGPVVLVVLTAGVLDIGFAKDNPNINAIIWAGYPGQEGGQAIADILFGKYNPGGRLPLTWYQANYVDQVPMTSMLLRPDDTLGYPGRTYKFFNGTTVYPFGYGLSYSTYNYTLPLTSPRSVNIKLGKLQHCRDLTFNEGAFRPACPAVLVEDTACEEELEFEVDVFNNGTMDGSHVVMVYSTPPAGIARTHAKKVIGFQRVFVQAGESTTVKFTFNVCKSLSIVEYNGYTLLPSGGHTITVDNGLDGLTFPFQVNFVADEESA